MKKGFKHSIETKNKISISNTGDKSSQWKGDNVGYTSIHEWLRNTFGKANKCENRDCNHKSKNFEYALIKKKSYKRKRENFIMMCKSCHHKYDMTDELRKKISDSNKGKIISEEHKKILSNRMKVDNPSFGGLSEEHKMKIKKNSARANKGTHLSNERKEYLRNLYKDKSWEELYGNKKAKLMKKKLRDNWKKNHHFNKKIIKENEKIKR